MVSILERALHRAEQGRSLSAPEVAALVGARGETLERLARTASRIADLVHGPVVTWARRLTVSLAPEGGAPPAMETVLAAARDAAGAGARELRVTDAGPAHAAALRHLEAAGYPSAADYARAVCVRVIEGAGLLPTVDAGALRWDDLARLRHACVGAHLRVAADATDGDRPPPRSAEDTGRLAIPLTVTLGSPEDGTAGFTGRLLAVRTLHHRFRHVQAVALEPPPSRVASDAGPALTALVATARVVLGPDVAVLVPAPVVLEAPSLLRAGASGCTSLDMADAGGTADEALASLRRIACDAGLALRERLALVPAFALRPDPYIAARMRAAVAAQRDSEGFADAERGAEPTPWQDPDVVWKARPQAASGPAARGRLRDDAAAVYGDFDALPAPSRRGAPAVATPGAVHTALARAERRQALDDGDALALFSAEGDDLNALCTIADGMRRDAAGDVVTYVVNRNINFTNVCYTGCRFCAFAQREMDEESYTLTLAEVADRAAEAWERGATEVCMQGGIHPGLPGEFYFRLLDAVRERVPGIHIHAFSPMEVLNGSARLGISFAEFLQECRRRGLGTIPGTAAEILDDDVRWVLTKGKLPAATWEEIVTTAHRLGIRSSSTIMFGHVDEPRHWVAHLRRLAAIQQRTGGFTEFVPLPFVHLNAPIYLAGKARPGATFEESRRMHAVARILLDGLIPNIQVSWVKLGLDACRTLLDGGANDLGGTLMEETISRMAGASHGVCAEPETLEAAIRAAGRVPRQRTTTYGPVSARSGRRAALLEEERR